VSLTDLWKSSKWQLEDKHIQQIIAFAGRSGRLRDGNDSSEELREYLTQVPSDFLSRYAEECLDPKGRFDNSGLALQDIINQVGNRLGFNVTSGRYRGTTGQIGFDGAWLSAEGHLIVVEVKTTDAYRLDLNVIANYRRALIMEGKSTGDCSSILIVVGREDTGDLEAQIRGSRHAWDIRLISVDALTRLMKLKEEVDDPKIVRKIGDILIPREFTKLDGIIDIVFSAAEDVLQGDTLLERSDPAETPTKKSPTGPILLAGTFHELCLSRIEQSTGMLLVKKSRTTYQSSDSSKALICMTSKEYASGSPSSHYWFGFHRYQKEILETCSASYVAFGCGSERQLLLIPFPDFVPWLDEMNTTTSPDDYYWHVRILAKDGDLTLLRKPGYEPIQLSSFLLH